MEAIAKTKYLKGSPRKARLVIDLIRGRNVSQALSILKFTDKRAADPIAKTLRSAIANATHLAEQQNIAIDPDDLWVKTCFVDMGPTKNRRRMRPAPQGRAYREQRHYCHITIQLTSDNKAEDEKTKKYAEAKVKRDAAKVAAGGTVKTKGAGKPAKKTDTLKETKTTKAEKAEEIETPMVEAAPAEVAKTTRAETVAAVDAKNESEVADAKDATSQTPDEKNETKPADDKQQDINEELERQ
ncbi:MAG TPA: 50S ribosomal protein L22 [Pyrinomonadaceae bacterium]|nr:50S ribosomal protein L22 [Pyrinomonadaceae bacterium]